MSAKSKANIGNRKQFAIKNLGFQDFEAHF
jgi:hypothetical protein